MNGDIERCPNCDEEISDYSPCSCAFTPRHPRASSSSASPTSGVKRKYDGSGMRAMSHRRWGIKAS